jgi:hypothetical protein
VKRTCARVIAAAALLGCSPPVDRDPDSIATKYVEQRSPESLIGEDGRRIRAVVEDDDDGAYWRVYFVDPGFVGVGGGIYVIIRKADLKVIKVVHEQ